MILCVWSKTQLHHVKCRYSDDGRDIDTERNVHGVKEGVKNIVASLAGVGGVRRDVEEKARWRMRSAQFYSSIVYEILACTRKLL
jgi:hypothetical protein